MTPRSLLVTAALLRVALLLYGEVQDCMLPVRYTDIDYDVFTDAAGFIAAGVSPYQRSTYRYSPLLATLLLPNIWLHRAWGKVLFSAGDVLAGWLLLLLLQLQGISGALANTALLTWLYNPFTLTISTRGSCDVLVIVMLLMVLLLLATRRIVPAALVYGLAVHFRIYPIIFAPSIVLFLARQHLMLHDATTACKLIPHLQKRKASHNSIFASGHVASAHKGNQALAALHHPTSTTTSYKPAPLRMPGLITRAGAAAAAGWMVPGRPAASSNVDNLTRDKVATQCGCGSQADMADAMPVGSLTAVESQHAGQSATGMFQGMPDADIIPAGRHEQPPPSLRLLPAAAQEAVTFGVLSGGAFLALGAASYWFCGEPFLQEAYLHHLTRRDPRHNFSVYFYHLYLTFDGHLAGAAATEASRPATAIFASGGGGLQNSSSSTSQGSNSFRGGQSGGGGTNSTYVSNLGVLLWGNGLDPVAWAFVPQLLLLLVLTWRFHSHLPMCWLLLTWAFVTFNKVVTAQYFVWYLSLLPLVMPSLLAGPLRQRQNLVVAATAWVLTQLHWLGWAYHLEFQSQSVYLGVWAAGILFLVANAAVMVQLMRTFAPRDSFLLCSVRACWEALSSARQSKQKRN